MSADRPDERDALARDRPEATSAEEAMTDVIDVDADVATAELVEAGEGLRSEQGYRSRPEVADAQDSAEHSAGTPHPSGEPTSPT